MFISSPPSTAPANTQHNNNVVISEGYDGVVAINTGGITFMLEFVSVKADQTVLRFKTSALEGVRGTPGRAGRQGR